MLQLQLCFRTFPCELIWIGAAILVSSWQ
jgi:hypothetical protein